MESTDEIIAFCESKGFAVSEKGASRILEQFKKVNELSVDDLDAVAGGAWKVRAHEHQLSVDDLDAVAGGGFWDELGDIKKRTYS